VTDTPPQPIRKSLLPTTPPSEWQFHSVFGAPHGCLLMPSDMGPVVVRRRVTYGDWEPVRPDRWADEPSAAAGMAAADQAGPSRRAGLRDRMAAAMREHYLSSNRDDADADRNMPCVCGDWREPGAETDDENDWDSHLADVVLAVLYREWPWLRAEAEDATPPADRAAVLRSAADQIDNSERLRDFTDDHMTDVHEAANEPRRLADEAQQQPEAEDDEALRAKVDDATATLRRIRSTIKSWEQQALPHSQAHRLLTEVRDALAGPNPDPDPEPEPTPEDTVRAHVTTLHLIGEQLADVESWLWDHLGDVREAARRERGGPLPDDVAPAAPESEPSVHGESVAHLAGLHDDEQEQSETETLRTPAAGRAPTELRVRVLREILNRLDGSRSDGDSATQDVGASMVRAVLADILADMQPAVDARQDGARQTDAETLAAIFEGFGRLLATSSRDWSEHPADAWLYAVICGWDCEQAEHDETCTHGAMEEMQERHGWYDDTVAKARRYRATVRALTAPAAGARQDGAQQ
jgi:hypothetical protein